MAYATDSANIGGPSRARSNDRDLDSPQSSDHAAIRLRFLVPHPNDQLAVSRRLVDSVQEIQSCRRTSDRDGYVVTLDQLEDLYILSQQNLRNASSSGFAAIESQLTELSGKVSEVHQAVRSGRPWSRLDPLPPANSLPSYAPLVPLSETTPPASYSRDRPPYGIVAADGRVYGIMEDQRRVWGYSGPPNWPREYEHTRSSTAAAPAEPPWYPIGRRSSRAEDTQLPPGEPHRERERERDRERDRERERPDGNSTSSSSYDVRPSAGRRSPPPLTHAGSSSSTSTRPGSGDFYNKLQHPPILPFTSNGNSNSNVNVNTTPSSTAVTDVSSKAPSISFLINPSHNNNPVPRIVSRDSESPPSYHHHHHIHSGSRERIDDSDNVMDVDGRRQADMFDASCSNSTGTTVKGGKGSKADASAKRRIRNGACTFCREKKLACRPGPMADDPNAAGPPACDQCYRRQRTCQHDPEHRRRRRIAIAPKKPAPATPEDLSVELPPPFDVDADDSAGTRMESEEPSVLPAAVDGTFTRLVPIPVKDEEVDQLETDWMQPE